VIHDDKSDHYGVITVHEALEHSSDVAAVKLAQKVGQDKFYEYIRSFGFGARSGTELPGETRGLLQPASRWGVTSYASIAIGQEVAVTPLQLVSMVSTIANGGVYLPPHVLMPGQVDSTAPSQGTAPPQPAGSLQPQPFKAGGELPNPLPPGAHRVITTLTAAQMRKMMEGVVLFGTGKAAQLNGYSSGGKTGTAQKIDPATHTYSKTMHVASFAGIAPVNNPVISVAVVMDNPKGAYYGASVSAPVFAEVAQQVLEYLGVPHDIDVHPPKTSSKPAKPITEDDAHAATEDINALFAAANDLPSDDPLRAAAGQAGSTGDTAGQPATQAATPAAQSEQRQGAGQAAAAAAQSTPPQPNATGPSGQEKTGQQSATVLLAEANLLRVPSLIGLPMRKVIEQAAAAGLEVQITGNGTAREQAPAPGAMVPPGTHIVVRSGHS
jgi:cell division protein FtsI (penicillin-binding protein 3)